MEGDWIEMRGWRASTSGIRFCSDGRWSGDLVPCVSACCVSVPVLASGDRHVFKQTHAYEGIHASVPC